MKSLFYIFLFTLTLLNFNIQAQDTVIELTNTTIDVNTVAENLMVPWDVIYGPDDHLWITEKRGVISRINPEDGSKTVLLELEDCEENVESGLLGMALHPDFSDNPFVYIVYSFLDNGDLKEKLVRLTYDEMNQSLEEAMVLFDEIDASIVHNGSRIIITPDLKIIMSTGDSGNVETSQDLGNYNGKFLRLNLDGSIPADNPYGADNPVYSVGHRNAQGLVLADNGILYSSEHGPNSDDELNTIEVGRNYGWPEVLGFCNQAFEQGFCDENAVVEPLVNWTPTIAVCGIDYYDHPAIPEWRNSILMAVLKEQHFKVMNLNDAGTSILDGESQKWLDEEYGRMRDLCVAPDGRIFITSSNNDQYGDPDSFGSDKIIELSGNNEINSYPKADFIMNEISPGQFQFENLSLNADSYLWEFGTGDQLIDVDPSYTFETGSYTISLTASNENYSHTKYYNIGINPNQALSDFSFESNCFQTQFSNNSSNSLFFEWSFGDGSVSSEANPMHTFDEIGTYTVQLISSNNLMSDTVSYEINIACDFAEAAFSYNDSCFVVEFYNESPFAEDFQWAFGDGNESFDESPVYTYSEAGTFEVELIVSGAFNSDTLKTSIQIEECVLPGIGDIESILRKGKISPNPFHTSSLLEILILDGSTLNIYDSSGKLMKQEIFHAEQKNYRINAGDYPSGLYLLEIQNEERTYFSEKFLIQ